MYARYAVTADCAFGSIVGLGLRVSEEVIGINVDVVAGFTAPSPAPQPATAKTVRVKPAAIRFRFVNAFSLPGLARRLQQISTSKFEPKRHNYGES